MKTKFKQLLKGVFLTSFASLTASNEANAVLEFLPLPADVVKQK